MSVDNSIELWLHDDEYVIDDAASVKSWIKGLQPLLTRFAEQNYATEYESATSRTDLDKDVQRQIAEKIGESLLKFRENSKLKPDDQNYSELDWPDFVREALINAVGNDTFGECAQETALDHSKFGSLYEEIDQAMSEHDGPTCDIDELHSEMYSQTVHKMQELDTSTILDAYGKPAIKFMFVPGASPKNGDLDNYSLYLDDLQTLDAESHGFEAFVKLTGVDHIELMSSLNVDHTDTDTIDKWLDFSPGAGFVRNPVISMDQVIELLENAGARYATPCWLGELTINEILKIDPLAPIQLTGGSIGLRDWTNGAGYMIDLPKESKIILGQNDWINREYGHEMECETGNIAKYSNEPKKKPRFGMNDEPSLG